jgi:hypothetical protein
MTGGTPAARRGGVLWPPRAWGRGDHGGDLSESCLHSARLDRLVDRSQGQRLGHVARITATGDGTGGRRRVVGECSCLSLRSSLSTAREATRFLVFRCASDGRARRACPRPLSLAPPGGSAGSLPRRRQTATVSRVARTTVILKGRHRAENHRTTHRHDRAVALPWFPQGPGNRVGLWRTLGLMSQKVVR